MVCNSTVNLTLAFALGAGANIVLKNVPCYIQNGKLPDENAHDLLVPRGIMGNLVYDSASLLKSVAALKHEWNSLNHKDHPLECPNINLVTSTQNLQHGVGHDAVDMCMPLLDTVESQLQDVKVILDEKVAQHAA
ncbi:hypothetical protein THRCLA_23467 [Thraustotheca clavata]|uniref:Uncharacterized protein n=1 Tax=Thraustotheca clavata TaxID=74557 RepID=A0A1V9Y490_9STRA|nr:hypothetical protein THRCLA_23467 [Thraustotheca clavata]